MPVYVYKARDQVGRKIKGSMQAVSEEELYDKLHKLGYLTTETTKSLPRFEFRSLLSRFQQIHAEDMMLFNVQLSNLIHAGVSLLDSLYALNQQIENKKLKEVVEGVVRSVESGESFSEALLLYPKIFSPLFINLVKAGEASGKLDMTLERYAAYCEEQAELRQKIVGAIFYPVILLVAGIAVSFFIVTVVVPQFAAIFTRVGIQLPLPTLILCRVATALKFFWHSILLFLMVAWLGIQTYTSTSQGKFQADWLKLKFPVVGNLCRKVAISRFARTLGMLVAGGVPLLTSLEIVREVIGNEVLAQVIGKTHDAVEKGEKISESFKVSGEFPLDAIQMIRVGEETGNLDEMLNKVADFYDRWAGYTVKKLTTLIEPLLLVVMACLLGFIMASMLLPMFDMIKVLRQARAGF